MGQSFHIEKRGLGFAPVRFKPCKFLAPHTSLYCSFFVVPIIGLHPTSMDSESYKSQGPVVDLIGAMDRRAADRQLATPGGVADLIFCAAHGIILRESRRLTMVVDCME